MLEVLSLSSLTTEELEQRHGISMLQEKLITLGFFPTNMTQKNRMCEWKEQKFWTPVIKEFLNFWIKKHFLAFQNWSFSLWFTGLKWNFLFSQKQFTIHRILCVVRDPLASLSDQSQHESVCPIQLPKSLWGLDSPCLPVLQMSTLP